MDTLNGYEFRPMVTATSEQIRTEQGVWCLSVCNVKRYEGAGSLNPFTFEQGTIPSAPSLIWVDPVR